MSKSIYILVLATLLLLSSCQDPRLGSSKEEEQEEQNIPTNGLENVPFIIHKDHEALPIVPNNQPQIEFDYGCLELIQSYIAMLGEENPIVRLVNTNKNNVKIELGSNPLVNVSLYNKSIFSTNTLFQYNQDNYSIRFRITNSMEVYQVEVSAAYSMSFRYDSSTGIKTFLSVEDEPKFEEDEKLQEVFYLGLEELENQKATNVLLQSSTLKMVQEMVVSSYHKRDTVITKDVIQKILPLCIESQVYEMPLSYVYNASSLWILGEVNLKLSINEVNQITGRYYAQEEFPIYYSIGNQEIEHSALFTYENGSFMVGIKGNDSFHYSYSPTQDKLLLNGSEYFSKEEETLFLSSALGIMQDFYTKYNGYSEKMERLIMNIQTVLIS